MGVDDNNKSKAFGFASFENHEEADACVTALNGKEIEEKGLYAGRAQKKAERSAELRMNYEKRKQDRQQKYQGVNLFVKNLDDTVDDEALRAQFAAHGDITSAKVMVENGSSKGFGFVCFSNPEEAQKAQAEMNGRIVGSKPLYVAMAQRKEDRKILLQQNYMRGAGAGTNIRQQMAPNAGFGGQNYPGGYGQMGTIPGYPGFGGAMPMANNPGKFGMHGIQQYGCPTWHAAQPYDEPHDEHEQHGPTTFQPHATTATSWLQNWQQRPKRPIRPKCWSQRPQPTNEPNEYQQQPQPSW